MDERTSAWSRRIKPKNNARARDVIFQPDVHRRMLRGIDQIVDAIRPTLGPLPRVVAITPMAGTRAPELLDSGGVIARRIIELCDRDEDMGAMLARAMICGLLAGPVCYASAVWVKKLLGYDDSLDAFGIHGAGGFLGALLTGWLADPKINALAQGHSVLTQLKGLALTIVWSAVGTLIILVICKYTTGLRVTAEEEEAGLDSSLHDEVMDH